jgi:hypothetical protein
LFLIDEDGIQCLPGEHINRIAIKYINKRRIDSKRGFGDTRRELPIMSTQFGQDAGIDNFAGICTNIEDLSGQVHL